jgi:hypothetical protein
MTLLISRSLCSGNSIPWSMPARGSAHRASESDDSIAIATLRGDRRVPNVLRVEMINPIGFNRLRPKLGFELRPGRSRYPSPHRAAFLRQSAPRPVVGLRPASGWPYAVLPPLRPAVAGLRPPRLPPLAAAVPQCQPLRIHRSPRCRRRIRHGIAAVRPGGS